MISSNQLGHFIRLNWPLIKVAELGRNQRASRWKCRRVAPAPGEKNNIVRPRTASVAVVSWLTKFPDYSAPFLLVDKSRSGICFSFNNSKLSPPKVGLVELQETLPWMQHRPTTSRVRGLSTGYSLVGLISVVLLRHVALRTGLSTRVSSRDHRAH